MTEEDKVLKLYKFFADFFLPAGMLDYFEIERMEESSPSKDAIAKGAEYSSVLDIYLKELDNRDESQQNLQMNGYTEYTTIEDFPAHWIKHGGKPTPGLSTKLLPHGT